MVDHHAQEIKRNVEQNTFVVSEEVYKKTRAEISSGGSLSAYRNQVFYDGALPLGIQRALGEVAVSGTDGQRHELTTSYVSEYGLMYVMVCHAQPSAEDLRTIYEYYNNSYAYNLRAKRGQEHGRVLMCMATNSHTPPDILIAMLANPYIRSGDVLDNPGFPRPVLTEILERGMRGDEQSRISVAYSKHATVAMLEKLASDPSARVRWWVADNNMVPVDLLLKLDADQDGDVVRSADAAIFKRLKEGDSILAHRLLAAGVPAAGFATTIACQKYTTDADLQLIFRHFDDQPKEAWQNDSLAECLKIHPNAPRSALLSLLH
jgi:hypothetical protein